MLNLQKLIKEHEKIIMKQIIDSNGLKEKLKQFSKNVKLNEEKNRINKELEKISKEIIAKTKDRNARH